MKTSMIWISTVIMLFIVFVSMTTQAADLSTHALRLRHGMHYFFEHCSGCHTLRYLPEPLRSNDPMVDIRAIRRGSLAKQQALHWFGTQPPDLSLIASQRGSSWIKHYLTGFYYDAKRPFFSNNTWLPNTAMPNVLYPYEEDPVALDDLLLFLTEVAEPDRAEHYRIGLLVVGFIVLLGFLTQLLSFMVLYHSHLRGPTEM